MNTNPIISDLNTNDQAYAHGSWRAWSKLFLMLATDNGYSGPLDYETAATAIRSVSGTRPALMPPGPTRSGRPTRPARATP